MQVRFANRDEFAWDMGENSYEPGDSLATGVAKAGQQGLRPGCNGYSAFITAFSRRMRQYRDANAKASTSASSQATPLMQAPQEGLQPAG
jgi:hypothetical protein